MLRRINEARDRNRHLRATSFGNPVTLDDIEKHFRRKKPEFDARNPDVEIPTSPTPSNISCTSLSRSPSPEPLATGTEPRQLPSGEADPHFLPPTNPYASAEGGTSFVLPTVDLPPAQWLPGHTTGFPSHCHCSQTDSNSHACSALVTRSHLSRPMMIDPVERGFFTLRDLIDVDFAAINHQYPKWWEFLDRIATDFDDAQLNWMARKHDQARSSYDKVLAAVTPYAQMPSIALLQLVSFLLSWTAYRVSKDLVQSLFAYLARLEKANPDLAYMLGCLANPDHASCAIALYQECISKYLTTGQGANSITVLRMNMKLCRHAFATDDQEPAWLLLREIHNLRTIYKESIQQLTTPELDQELEETLQLFHDRSMAKTSLEEAMSACSIDESPPNLSEDTDCTQQHSMCNFKLGLYAVAHKQANATLTCFRKLYRDDDSRIASAKSLLDRAETLMNEIHNAGIDWPAGEFTDWNDTTQLSSMGSVCASPSSASQTFPPRSHSTRTPGRRSLHNSHPHSSPPRSIPPQNELSRTNSSRRANAQRLVSWTFSEVGSTSDDSATYSPAFVDTPAYQSGTPTSLSSDRQIFEVED